MRVCSMIIGATVKAAKWAIDMNELTEEEIKEKADILRKEFCSLRDRDIVYFSMGIFDSRLDNIKSHVQRIAFKVDPEMPF